MQILRQGLTIWFDGSGGTKKTIGIRYPFIQRGSGANDTGGDRGGYGGYGYYGYGGYCGISGTSADADAPAPALSMAGRDAIPAMGGGPVNLGGGPVRPSTTGQQRTSPSAVDLPVSLKAKESGQYEFKAYGEE